MQLTLTEEQAMVRASAQDWLADHYDFRQREASLHRDGGSPAAWEAFAQLGWLGLPLPESAGGMALGLLECCLVAQALGRKLVVEPWQACVLEAGRLLALAGTAQQQEAWLPGVVAGRHRLALADREPGQEAAAGPLSTRAVRTPDGWRLHGRKQAVVGAAGAARWLVSAHDEEQGGTRVFLLDPQTSGSTVDAYDAADGSRAADLTFEGVVVPESQALPAGAATALDRVRAEALVAQCWHATGAMQAALEQTADYVGQRRQFGQPLAKLQVVQHRIAEMAVLCVEAEAACELACLRLQQDPDSGAALAAMARIKTLRSARYVSQQAVQLHGAMGVCEELPIAATFRALTVFRQLGGDEETHARAFGHHLLASGEALRSQTLRD